MKHISFFAFLAAVLVLGSCKKSAPAGYATHPVPFTKTTYSFLGTFDSVGVPGYLVRPHDTISSGLIAFLNSQLPKHVNATKNQPQYFSSSASANISFFKKTQVYITFVQETASYKNALGFYSYPSNTPPSRPDLLTNITYIFPNAKLIGHAGGLYPGDKVLIGTFAPGTSIGFVLMQNAFTTSGGVGQIDNNAPHLCSQDELNPEDSPDLKRHVILLNYTPENKTLISFEDQNRATPQCDNDFSDVTIYATQVVVP